MSGLEAQVLFIALITPDREGEIIVRRLVVDFQLLRELRWPVKAAMVVSFCLLSATEVYREPTNTAGIFADQSAFLRGTLYREKEMPDIISRMLEAAPSGIGPLIPDAVKFIRMHPINLESKWALNVLNRNFLSGNSAIELRHLDEILSLCDPVFVILNVDEEMKIWLLNMLQRYMGQPGLSEKRKVFNVILVYAPYLIERGPTERVRAQAVDALRTFAENAGFGMLSSLFDASFELLKNEAIPYELRLGLEEAIRRVSFRYVMDMRIDHLERRLSDEGIFGKLMEITGNDPVKLYAFFTDHWMYGTLADEIFSMLEENARLAGEELYTYLEGLDPLKHFFESFLFSSINFSKSDRWFRTEDTVQRAFRYMFGEISRESLTANAALTQVFVERLLSEKGPHLSSKCERLLMEEYQRCVDFHKYFIAATIVLHRGWFHYLDEGTVDRIARENAINWSGLPSDLIDYSRIVDAEKRHAVDAHVIFADRDSLAYYRSAVRMFSRRGYRYVKKDKDLMVLEKRGPLTMRVTIENKSEVPWRLGADETLDPYLKVVMIRGHNGIQGAVFSGKGTEITAGTHVILSLCRGMYEASRYRFKYPGTHWIASKSSVVGIMANAVMVSLIDGLRMKKPTYSSIKAESIRLSPATNDFVFPNDPAFVIGSLIRLKQEQD